MLGIFCQVVNQRRKLRKIIGLSKSKGKYLYPLWRFNNIRNTLSELEDVLEKLQEFYPWIQISFFLNPSQNKTPLEMLRMAKVEPIVQNTLSFVKDELG